jgi:hypothetical protein
MEVINSSVHEEPHSSAGTVLIELFSFSIISAISDYGLHFTLEEEIMLSILVAVVMAVVVVIVVVVVVVVKVKLPLCLTN